MVAVALVSVCEPSTDRFVHVNGVAFSTMAHRYKGVAHACIAAYASQDRSWIPWVVLLDVVLPGGSTSRG